MIDRFCQECGERNPGTATTCSRCGAVLKAGIPPAAAPAYPAPAWGPPGYGPPGYGPPGYPYPVPDYAVIERGKQVDRTKWGLLVLTVTFLILWLPNIVTVCLTIVLFLAGIILMAMGRKAFGGRHSVFVMGGIALIVIAIAAIAILTVWLAAVLFGIAGSGSLQGIGSTLWAYLIGAMAVGMLQALAPVLLAHELSARIGKILLYAAFASTIVLQIAVLVVVAPAVDALIAALESGAITDPADPRLAALDSATASLSLVGAVPDILLAGAFLLAYRRITRREIPAPGPGAGIPVAPWAPSPSPAPPPPPSPPAAPIEPAGLPPEDPPPPPSPP